MTKRIELKGSSFTLSALHLSDGDLDKTTDWLKQKVDQAPDFFASAPIVIDVNQLEGDIDFGGLKNAIKQAGMIPVGISGCKDKTRQQSAKDAGFALMTAARAPKQPEPSMVPTKIVRTPVRSGQQIYAKNCDLIVMNHVSAGAEIIADGCIHVFGTLRGRALAGASGHRDALIVCQDLRPELISIAGNYWLSDQIDEQYWNKGVTVSLTDNSLHIKHLAL